MDLYAYYFKYANINLIIDSLVETLSSCMGLIPVYIFNLRVRSMEVLYQIKSDFIYIKYNNKNKIKYGIDNNTNMHIEYDGNVYNIYVNKKEYKNNNMFLYNKFIAYKILGFYPDNGILDLTLQSKNNYIDDISELFAMKLTTHCETKPSSLSKKKLNSFLYNEIFLKKYDFSSYNDKKNIDYNFFKEALGYGIIWRAQNLFIKETKIDYYDDIDFLIEKISNKYNYKFNIEYLDFSSDEAKDYGVSKYSGLYANKINEKELYIAFNTNININKSRYLFLKLIGYELFKCININDSLILNLRPDNKEIDIIASNIALDFVVTFEMTYHTIYRSYAEQEKIKKYTDYDLISLKKEIEKINLSIGKNISVKNELRYIREHKKEYMDMKGKKDNGKI